jgi:hypothetical protein
MRKVTRILIVLAMMLGTACFTANAASGGWSEGYVGRIYAGPFVPPHVFFVVMERAPLGGSIYSASHHNAPACSTVGGEWALDTSTLGGQQAFQLLLHEQAGGADIRVVGTGACTTWPDREDVLYLYSDLPSPPVSGP